MKKGISLLILLTTTLLCHAQLQPQYVKLGLNLIKGTTYINNTIANVNMVQTVNGQKSTVNTTISSKLAFKVVAIRDTLYDMEVRYLSMGLKMQLPTGNSNYCSESADPELISSIMAAFKNQPFKVVLTKTGKLQSITGINAVWEHAVAGFSSLMPEQKAQIKSLVEQSFGERALKSNFDMGTVIYPTIAVRQTARWTLDTQMETVRPAVLHSVYELRDITPTHYLIHVNSTITYVDKDKFVESNGIPIRYNLAGTMLTDIKVDKTTGWVAESKTVQHISGNTEIKDTPQTPGGLKVPMVMMSEIVITDK